MSDAEVAAVDDGIAAMEDLIGKLADVPTPVGPTPREISISVTGTEAERRKGAQVSDQTAFSTAV